MLDPVADKLTEGAVVLCLMTRYRWVAALVVLYVLKEGFMAVAGLVMLRRGKKLTAQNGSARCVPLYSIW